MLYCEILNLSEGQTLYRTKQHGSVKTMSDKYTGCSKKAL